MKNRIKNRNCIIVAVLLFIILSSTNAVQACTAFSLVGKNYCVIGFNENWRWMPCMVTINPRGVNKENISWKQLTSKSIIDEPKVGWKSKYGSITFSVLGIDLPCYGVNEKGLFFVELALKNTFNVPDSVKPRMFWGNFIQFQLDNYATVEEVISNIRNAPVIDWWPKFTGSHFYLSDANGCTSVIEYNDGKVTIINNDSMAVKLLCNAPYSQQLKSLQQYKAFGGTAEIDTTQPPKAIRFPKASHQLISYSKEQKISPIDYAWNILNSNVAGEWQLVGDIRNKKLYFCSKKSPKIKSLDYSKIDFSGKKILCFDLDTDIEGGIDKYLQVWDFNINKYFTTVGFPAAYPDNEFFKTQEYQHLLLNIERYITKTYK